MNNKKFDINLLKNKYVLVILIIVSICLLSLGTYAYWTWTNEEDKNVVFSTASLEKNIIYDEGNSNFVGNFQVTSSFCQGTNTTISFYKKTAIENMNVVASINMDVNSIGANMSSSSSVYWVLTKGDNTISCSDGISDLTSNTNVVNYGTFNGKTNGETITLKSNIDVTTTEKKYTIWLWISDSATDISNLSGETLDTNIWTQFDQVEGNSSSVTGEAYAVYSEDDNSLRFYRSETPITVGSTYNGLTVTNVYDDFENAACIINEITHVPSYPEWYEDIATVVTSVYFEDKIYPISTCGWFYNFTNTSFIDVTNLDTSKVTNMAAMFEQTGGSSMSVEIINLNNWDTSQVTDMTYMFKNTGFRSKTVNIGNLSNWNTSKVTSTYEMFYQTASFTETFDIGNIGGWDVSQVTDMEHMFYSAGARSLIFNIGDLSNWNTSNVIYMNYMFGGTGRSAEWTQDLSNWNVENVTDYTNFDFGVEDKIIKPLAWQ